MRNGVCAAIVVALTGVSAGGCATSSDAGSSLAALAPEPAAASPAPGADGKQQTATVPQGTTVAFAAVIGAPDKALASLSQELSARAKARGIAIADAAKSQHVLKGYLSTIDDGASESVVYVWDVTDAAGNRLYRIQGQRKLAKGGGWDAVDEATMRAIADDTVDQLAGWIAAAGSASG